ncbi:MAG: FGGY-family carbohydrate kinase [Eubacteriaceae bacterium]
MFIMQAKEYVLAIDCGTQSIRGLIFDKVGTLVAKEVEIFNPPYFSLNSGWAERNAQLYWEDLIRIMNKLKKNYTNYFFKICSISLTTQRDTCVLIDNNGSLLRPAILWVDQRKIKKPKSINSIYNSATKLIGMKKTIEEFNRSCHAHWIQENEPEIWEKSYKYLMLSTFLIYKLTGNFIDTPSAQTGHLPFNYKKKKWEHSYALKSNIFQIPKEKLYPLIEAGELFGKITQLAAKETGLLHGTPVIASGSDKACETLGVGCINNELGSISLGSQATIETATKKYYEAIKFIPPFPAIIPDVYNPEINVYRGYWMITWFKNEFALKELIQSKSKNISPEELLDKRLNEIPPGCDGLILQPYWGKEIVRPESRGSIIGFNEQHTRIHLYRAIIEGIGFALLDGLNCIENKSSKRIERLALSGGGAQSEIICQIMADLFNREIYTVQTNETSGLGAAISSFVGMGVYNDFQSAVKGMVHEKSVYKPKVSNVKIYSELYNKVYKNIYKNLKGLYRNMEDIY